MVQLIILQASPAVGVAFGDCIVGAVGIFASSYMTRRAATVYLAATVLRLVLPIAFYSTFFALFVPNPKLYLSDLLCTGIALVESEMTLSPEKQKEAAEICAHAGTVVTALIATLFALSVTLCWYPCCRCSLYLRETLVEKEALVRGRLADFLKRSHLTGGIVGKRRGR